MNYPYTSKRVVACLIDYTLVFVLTYYYVKYFGTEDERGVYHVRNLAVLPPIILWFVYFVVAETLGGTLGHRIFRLKVVSMNGQEVPFDRILIRRLCDTLEISWCFGLIAYILVRSTPHHQRLGDIVAKTQVIRKGDLANTTEFDFEKNTGGSAGDAQQARP
jgi:uncharacterized RDD family membrane protein YckC